MILISVYTKLRNYPHCFPAKKETKNVKKDKKGVECIFIDITSVNGWSSESCVAVSYETWLVPEDIRNYTPFGTLSTSPMNFI